MACVAGVIGEGDGERGRQSPSFFLASLASHPLPRLRRPRRLTSDDLSANYNLSRTSYAKIAACLHVRFKVAAL